MARRNTDMHRAQRERLLRLERQAKAREEDAALEASLAATVAHGEEKGAEFERKPQKRGEARKPIRRLTGLGWLLGKGRITQDQYAAGARYASAYQKSRVEIRIQSILNRDPTGGEGRTMADLIADGEERVYAAERLVKYRNWLLNQGDLVGACDAICGEEMTPREAAANGREAEAVEAILKVALDLISLHVAPRRGEGPQNVDLAA